MKRPLTVAVALALLAGSVATAQADNHGHQGGGQRGGQSHGQSRGQWSGPSQNFHHFNGSRGGDHRNWSPGRDMHRDWNNGGHRSWNNDGRHNWNDGRGSWNNDGRRNWNDGRGNWNDGRRNWSNDGRSRRWDGRSSFGNVHFDDHRFVDRRDRFFPGPGFHDGFRGDHIRFRSGPYFRPYGYRAYAWRRGDYLPVAYYAPRYVIHDYRAYRLGPPPWGYHYVRVDNDIVLAAITTGIVLSVFDDIFW